MRKCVLYMVLVILLAVQAHIVLAVPECSQLELQAFCIGTEQCTPTEIQFQGSCANGTREWRCCWYCTGYGNVCTSFWTPCNCNDEGGCGCLLEGTAITMSDGTTRPVETIAKGDRVLAYDAVAGSMTSSEVLSVHRPYSVDHYYIINNKVRATEHHPMLRRGAWVQVGKLAAGDRLAAADGSEATVFAIQRID
jgi:hypothetical protein